MADAIVSVLVEQIIPTVYEQIKNEIHLVRGVDEELLNLSDKLDTIRNVLDDADNRRFTDKNINKWLSRLEETSHEIEDILDEWNYDILKFKIEHDKPNNSPNKQKVCSFVPSPSFFCFKKIGVRHDIAKKIQNAKAQLDRILAEKDQFNFVVSRCTKPLPEWRKVQTTSLIHVEEVQGRDSDKNNLVRKIISEEAGLDFGGHRVVSIVGVGGLGKTTLAQLVYNDGRLKEYFDLSLWICVSGPFDENQIAKEIIGSCNIETNKLNTETNKLNTETKQLNILLKQVIKRISGKKFLLVLDDVWTEDWSKWKPLRDSLKFGGAGSTVMVTTRNEKVARMMGTMENDIYRLGQLSDEDCYMLLCRAADISGRKEVKSEEFESIGKKIADKCKGLPLAAKVLGSLLLYKKRLDEWKNILNNEIWQLKEAKVDLFPHLLLSYNELSPQHRRCFSYCAVFPKDSDIDVQNLIDYWMVLGYLGSSTAQDLEHEGRECFDILAMHSLFQDFGDGDKYCKMHDIVHDFAQFLRKNGRVKKIKTCKSCSSSLVSHVKEYRSLFWEKVTPPYLCDCLRSLRVLKIECYSNWQTIPQRMKNMIHLRWLDLSYNDLSSADLRTVFQLYNLQVVNFSWCRLLEIPAEIGNLTHLRALDLSDNSELKELPTEIGNLTHLRVLDLGGNYELKELPGSICSLLELQILDVERCWKLYRLPEGIHSLTNLKYLYNVSRTEFPNGLAQLTGLCGMTVFYGGSGCNKLGLLKNLNKLCGRFDLHIRLNDEELEGVVEDAREAELRKKEHIEDLKIWFGDEIDAKEEDEESPMRMDVIDALEPHPNLQKLFVLGYKGSKLASGWLQTLNQLRCIVLADMDRISSLPPLWKLSCLEEIRIEKMQGLEFVGREFLGIKTGGGDHMNIESSISSAAAAAIAFPKLKKLVFFDCPKWKEWEDIMAEEEEEEEEAVAISLMPCLTELHVKWCPSLMALPHRLLRQARSLETLRINGSVKLRTLYRDKDTSPWISQLIMW